MGIYHTHLGANLVNTENYPIPVARLLEEEELLLCKCMKKSERLVEVGCMNGRHLEWALKNSKAYLGIDVVSTYVNDGQGRVGRCQLDPKQFGFVVGSAESITAIAEIAMNRSKDLIFFPFNSFGNITNVHAAIDQLAKISKPLFISSYTTSEEAARTRMEYYANSGIMNMRYEKSLVGDCFSSDQGFRSVAYDPVWLLKSFQGKGVKLYCYPLSSIGVAYTSFDLGNSQLQRV